MGTSFALLPAVVLGSGLRRPIEPKDAKKRTLFSEYMPVLRDHRIMVMIGALMFEVYAISIADVAFVFLITVTLAAGPLAFGLPTACWAGGMMAGATASGTLTMPRPAPIAFISAVVMGPTMLTIGIAALTLAGVARKLQPVGVPAGVAQIDGDPAIVTPFLAASAVLL